MAKQGAARNADAFTEPDDDFAPVMLWSAAGGLSAAPIDSRFFSGVEGKNQLAAKIKRTIRNRKPYAIAFVISAWHADLTPAESLSVLAGGGPEVAPADHPGRREVLMIEVSDHLEDEIWFAPIIRHQGAPPTLGEWQLAESFRGRFYEAIAAGFKRQPTPPERPQG